MPIVDDKLAALGKLTVEKLTSIHSNIARGLVSVAAHEPRLYLTLAAYSGHFSLVVWMGIRCGEIYGETIWSGTSLEAGMAAYMAELVKRERDRRTK